MEWLSSGIQPAKVFHLACRILEGKAPLCLLTVAQTSVDLPTTEDPEEAARWRARLATEAIASFDAHASDGQEPTSSYDSPTSASTAYFSNVTTRLVCKRQGIQPGMVHMVNDSGILVVSRAGATRFELLPGVWWWIREYNLLWSAKNLHKNCGWRSTTWLFAHLPLSHWLATWSGPHVIRGSHYSIASAWSLEIHLHLFFFGVWWRMRPTITFQLVSKHFTLLVLIWTTGLKGRGSDQVGRLGMAAGNLFMWRSRQPLL